MIRPSKYMKLQQCPLLVAAVILQELQSLTVVIVSDIEESVADRLGDGATIHLQEANNLLFLFACLEYDEPSDVLVFTGGAEP